MSVTFATKCWGGDYNKFLSGAMERKVEAIGYPFSRSFLVANNGVPKEMTDHYLEEGANLPAYDAEFCKEGTVKCFNLEEANVYALGELTAIRWAYATYLCYVQGDCMTSGGDWVTPAIKALESEPDVMIVSPASEVNTWHDESGYDHYMSDQAFVIRVKDFQNPEVYHIPGVDPDYPAYGGNSFEHMVGKYLKASGKKRKILTDFYVQHPAW